MTFNSLKSTILGLSATQEQRHREERFWTLLSQTRLHKWSPGERINNSGLRLLVGLAPGWSLPDLEIADLLVEVANMRPDLSIDLFDASVLSCPEKLAEYIPNRLSAYHTPIVGIWENGVFVTTEEGFRGRELLSEIHRGKLGGAQI